MDRARFYRMLEAPAERDDETYLRTDAWGASYGRVRDSLEPETAEGQD